MIRVDELRGERVLHRRDLGDPSTFERRLRRRTSLEAGVVRQRVLEARGARALLADVVARLDTLPTCRMAGVFLVILWRHFPFRIDWEVADDVRVTLELLAAHAATHNVLLFVHVFLEDRGGVQQGERHGCIRRVRHLCKGTLCW